MISKKFAGGLIVWRVLVAGQSPRVGGGAGSSVGGEAGSSGGWRGRVLGWVAGDGAGSSGGSWSGQPGTRVWTYTGPQPLTHGKCLRLPQTYCHRPCKVVTQEAPAQTVSGQLPK